MREESQMKLGREMRGGTYGNVVDDEHEGVGDYEAVEPDGARVSELVPDLDVVAIEPSSGNDAESIVRSDVG